MEDAKTKKEHYAVALKAQIECERSGNYDLEVEQKKVADGLYEEYLMASHALEEFEKQGW